MGRRAYPTPSTPRRVQSQDDLEDSNKGTVTRRILYVQYSKVIFIYLLKTYCRSLKKFRAKNYNKCYLKIVLKFLVKMFFLNLGKNRRKKGALTLLGDTDVSGKSSRTTERYVLCM